MSRRILIISPVRNEAAHIEQVARALSAQELPPARWIVVDDSSTDDTLEILRRLEAEISVLTVIEAVKQPKSGQVRDRLARAAAPRTFNVGLAAAGDTRDYTHVMKLDGDIELPPSYLRELTDRMAQDPKLGMAGCLLDEPKEGGGVRRIKIAPNHVQGAVKLYTRECFESIGGLQERLGWDTIDETYARMRGYTTRGFTDIVAFHHRPAGSADGVLRGHARHGECAYVAHFTLTWVTLRAVKIARRPPYVLSGLAFLYGFLRAGVRRVERVPDTEYRRFTRRELRRRLSGGIVSAIPRIASQPAREV
jgi:biofilm PGA synthesis N-glycosyltransferase PgaC